MYGSTRERVKRSTVLVNSNLHAWGMCKCLCQGASKPRQAEIATHREYRAIPDRSWEEMRGPDGTLVVPLKNCFQRAMENRKACSRWPMEGYKTRA